MDVNNTTTTTTTLQQAAGSRQRPVTPETVPLEIAVLGVDRALGSMKRLAGRLSSVHYRRHQAQAIISEQASERVRGRVVRIDQLSLFTTLTGATRESIEQSAEYGRVSKRRY
jgi:hypothetical protein